MNNTVTTESEAAWQDFLTRVHTTSRQLNCGHGTESEAWFRGHTKSDYPLMPSLFRGFKKPNGKDWEKIWGRESDLFWEFTARARQLHSDIEDDWDYLFAMQHYGTPTRLLDWTEVLGVAVYFAVLGLDETKEKDEDGEDIPPPCVWVMNPYRLNSDDDEDEADLWYPKNLGWDKREKVYYSYSELLLEKCIYFDWPTAIYPRQRNPRLHAQRAWFTIHGDEYVPLESIKGHENYLVKVELPRVAIPAARRFLDIAGIDHYLLFADLGSLSLHLKEKNGILTKTQAGAAAQKSLEARKGVPSQPKTDSRTKRSAAKARKKRR